MPLNFIRNDITHMRVDAIVNAANNSLLGGGGVDGAIHRAAGPELLAECRTLNGCDTGEAKLTRGYRLPCKYVIHTVGPIWRGGDQGEPELLAACYRNSLALAKKHECESIAFPMISTGVYGYPKAPALQIAVREVMNFLAENEMTVYFIVFSAGAMTVAEKLFGEITAYIDDVYVDTHYDSAREVQRSLNNYEARNAPPETGRKAVQPKAKRGLFHLPRVDKPLEAGRERLPDLAKPTISLDEMLAQMDEGFPAMLLRKIDERHLTDAECYKRANIDRRLFNKIKNNPGYRPGKQTVLAFAIALKLSLEETREMLSKAGYSLTHSSKADIVVEYCILNNIYDIIEINQVLFKLDLQPLGY